MDSSCICCSPLQAACIWLFGLSIDMGMGQNLLVSLLMGWTSIYQLFCGSLGTRVMTHSHIDVCLLWCVPQTLKGSRSSRMTPSEPRIQKALEMLQQDDTDWYFIPLLSESDTDLSRYSEDVKKQFQNLGGLEKFLETFSMTKWLNTWEVQVLTWVFPWLHHCSPERPWAMITIPRVT